MEANTLVQQFLQEFLDYPFTWSGREIRFRGNDFHIGGESYAGHYIPYFANSILEENVRAGPQGPTRIKLKSIMIGNPAVDKKTENKVAFEYVCDPDKTPNPAFQLPADRREKVCEYIWKPNLETCLDVIDDCRKDEAECGQRVALVCKDSTSSFYAGQLQPPRDMYDLLTPLATGQARNPIEGYKGNGWYPQWVIANAAALGSSPSPPAPVYRMCDDAVMNRFTDSGDYYRDFTEYYEAILASKFKKDIRVLIYAVRFL